MTDDFAATTLDREAMTFDEPLVEPEPARPATSGPAWAGTLAKLPAAPGPPAPPPIVEPAAPSAAMPAEPEDPVDFLATSLHQRAYDLEIAPPIDELSEHNRVLSALPGREPSGGSAPSEAGDRVLMVGLVVVASLIGLLVLALLIAGAAMLVGPIE